MRSRPLAVAAASLHSSLQVSEDLGCSHRAECSSQVTVQVHRIEIFEEKMAHFSEHVRKKFSFYSKHECQFVLFFAPNKKSAHADDVHHVLKLQEVEFGKCHGVFQAFETNPCLLIKQRRKLSEKTQ
ncbi:hypothetical protein GPALN_010415 [Globodera pallida]|nr:hypothetical protein GPALN_010415 [Globodera pallida]